MGGQREGTSKRTWLWPAPSRAESSIGASATRSGPPPPPTLAQPPVPVGSLAPRGASAAIMRVLGRARASGLLKRLTSVDPSVEQVYAYIPWTPVFNVTGQPAMSVPLHWSADGLPIGTHFVGRYGDEATLFRLAGQLERARPWAARRPKVCA